MGILKKGFETMKDQAKDALKKEVESLTKRAAKSVSDKVSKKIASVSSMKYGTPRPLLPERKVSFMTGYVEDKPKFIYQ